MIKKVLVFGDDIGMPQSIRNIGVERVCGLVAAEIRPKGHQNLQELAKNHKLSLAIQPRIKSPLYPSFVNQIQKLQPELIFVHSYSMLLHSDILTIPPFGVVNVHGALLPRYRGPNPTQWALINDEIETGVTMHYMDENFDSGDIIAQRHVPIFFDDTWQDIYSRIYVETEVLFHDEIPKLLAGINSRQPQDEKLATRFYRRHPEDGQIDWNQPVRDIYNLIRALVKPLPGAFYIDKSGKLVKLDEYLSITQVANLKYGEAGERVLTTEKLMAEPVDIEDFSTLTAIFNQNVYPRFSFPQKLLKDGKYSKCFELLQSHIDSVTFSIKLSQDNSLIGFCQLRNIDHEQFSAEVSIMLDGKIGSNDMLKREAVEILLKIAYSDLKLHRLCVHVINTDSKTVNVYKQAGFQEEGLLRAAVCIKGQPIDMVIMGMLR